MFTWLKKLFHKEPAAVLEIEEAPKMMEKPCQSCGQPVFFDPSWDHIPNYCRECRKKYQQDHEIIRVMRRKCRKCGKEFRFPSNIRHYPNYCKKCREEFRKNREQGQKE